MLALRDGWLRLICLGLASFVAWGCQIQRPLEEIYTEDTDTILEREYREQMLHVRTIAEGRGSIVFPVDSNVEIGFGGAFKGEIEVQKNLYLGMEIGYVSHDIDETAEDVLDRFNAGDPAAEVAVAGLDTLQWLDNFERINILFLFDYDIPFWDEPTAPIFRFGAGVGAALVLGDEVDSTTFAADIDADRVWSQILFRPSLGLRFPVHPNILLFADASYDWIPADTYTVTADLGPDPTRKRTKVGSDVDFSGFNLAFGLAFVW